MIRTVTTLDQDRRTESNCVCMYIVQRRVIDDNKCDFQHHQTFFKKRKIECGMHFNFDFFEVSNLGFFGRKMLTSKCIHGQNFFEKKKKKQQQNS